ncbi:hypothetical protein B7988_11970 [Fibrobacter sp. UWB1]|uniref:hypothetical protein n=1 Tax=Fibrobacter sp. UWB1 TaxID=1964355 RepID=UPI000B5263F8|nr:hypothetical protein [Fibrobacter sp. UWB1]OWV25179.1 hypothetical protein B7988_11970 [Fibrobacter sp. UWB1]
MNGKVLTATTIAALSCLVSTVWAERPSEKASCEFPGGAYYESNNTLYLESVNDENAKVQISEENKNCVNGYVNNGEFNLVVERSTKLATNSTIVLPMNYSPKSSCIKLYDPYAFTTNDEGVWNVFASNAAGNGVANRALLMITDTQRKECQDIKEIEFTASSLQVVNEHTQAQLERELHNPKSGANDWALEGSYNFIRWDKDHADLGKVYGYAAKDKNKVQAGHFTKVGAGAYIPPMRAYLKYRGQTPLAKSVESIVELPETIDVTLVEEDGTTRLARWNTVTGEMVKVNGWYDLKGRKLNSKPQNKGMFIGNTNIQK